MRFFISCLTTVAVIAGLWLTAGDSFAEKKESKVLRHLVLYQFKDSVTPAEVKEVIETFAGLPGKIDTIIDFEHGPNVSQEGKSEGLTYAFQVTFRDEEGLAAYLKHPAHDEYVQVVKDRRNKVVVFDYWTTEK